MIKFFRRIRLNLLSQKEKGHTGSLSQVNTSKTGKYLFYAIGEILLVVIGILIALQVNNWNDAKKNEDHFQALLQQIYTVIDQDAESLIKIQNGIVQQIEMIDRIMQNPNSIPPKLLPHILFYLDQKPISISSEVSYLLNYLNFDPENLRQANLNKSLASYANTINGETNTTKNFLTPRLEELNLPTPGAEFGYTVLNDFQNVDTTFFTSNDINKVLELIEEPSLQNALKSIKSSKYLENTFSADLISLAKRNKVAIREFYPEVKLLYADIGLVGDATENKNWDKDIKLKLSNELASIWEGDVVLSNGFVKFREGENWNFNWGGDKFPEGNVLSYGNNIKVDSGSYRVVFNLTDKTYRFIKQ